jgi:microcystin-dependent protein
MSKLSRVFQKLFGSTGTLSYFGQPGSLPAGTKVNTQDPATIQALSAFLAGLESIVKSGTYKVAMEDLNSLFLLTFRQLGYIFQAGIPEWDSSTTYYIGSYVQVSGVVYYSLIDSNINYSPASNPTRWAQGILGADAPGKISMYGGATAPTGYLICNGASLLRADYPALFTAIGTGYGASDGTHFNIPDFRGIFPRGVNNGAGNDPDAASRTAANPGGNTGDNVGSLQADDLKAHEHPIPTVTDTGSGVTSILDNAVANKTESSVIESSPAGGNETRPKNLYVNFIIKT